MLDHQLIGPAAAILVACVAIGLYRRTRSQGCPSSSPVGVTVDPPDSVTKAGDITGDSLPQSPVPAGAASTKSTNASTENSPPFNDQQPSDDNGAPPPSVSQAREKYPRRELRRRPCAVCQQSGFIATSTTSPCKKCDGVGWINALSGEQICPSCKGFQQVRVSGRAPCRACEGHGYTVFMIELRRVKETEQVVCKTCAGTGKRIKREYCRFWEDCPECLGSGRGPFGPCENCKGEGAAPVPPEEVEVDCGKCNGTGRRTVAVTKVVEAEVS